MKTPAFWSFLFLCSFSLSACSIYKSQGRKQFETDTPGKIKTYSLVSCQKQNAVLAWFQSEFPAKSYELVVTEPDLEIWKSTTTDGTIEIRAVQLSDSDQGHQQVTCNYKFANDDAWKAHQDQFIHELENNMMMAD